jgi:hypothetical protein
MDESKKGFLLIVQGKTMSKTQSLATIEDREVMNKISYASAIVSIMYAMMCKRTDMAHTISLTSRYQSNPGLDHWTTVKNIFKYLRRTKDMLLVYGVKKSALQSVTSMLASTLIWMTLSLNLGTYL